MCLKLVEKLKVSLTVSNSNPNGIFTGNSNKVISFPKAKINIGLNITGKREDGYHDIETVFYPVGLSDALEFVVQCKPGDEDLLTLTGIETWAPGGKNLVLSVVTRMREQFTFPLLKIHLHKAIPVGAGLGGGSSDAACMIKALNRYFGFGLTVPEMMDLALKTGSDCPFFIDPVPSFASGRGEKLTPCTAFLKGMYMVLLNPGFHVSTREAYAKCRPAKPLVSLKEMVVQPVSLWRQSIKNDFEEHVFRSYPLIGQLKDELYRTGALYSSMSGSGSSVYGIFGKAPVLDESLSQYVIWKGLL
jgi:4-diphosphocytidyl-2-C-methyl-D-erythritol kinase